MVIIITGASHTGKTYLAQKLLEKLKFPYYSIDHLKMGLIRSGITALTPYDDKELTPYLWNIVREIIKTAVENGQDLIIEGCYVPFDWKKDFSDEYLTKIRYICLVMSDKYIEKHFNDIKKYACVIENRIDDCDCNIKNLREDNLYYLEGCLKYGCKYYKIIDTYDIGSILKLLTDNISK